MESSLLQVHLLESVDRLSPRGEGREGWDDIKDVILLKRRSRRDLDVVGKKNDNFTQAATVE